MSRSGRNLQTGDYALTDYNGDRIRLTRVKIMARDNHSRSQSGIAFQVSPALRNGTLASWYDADWFEQEPQPAAKE